MKLDPWYIQQGRITRYIVAVFRWYITPMTTTRPPVSLLMDIQVACDCVHVAEQAAKAFLNPVYIPLDIAEYCEALTPGQSGRNPKAEQQLAERHPVPSEPALVTEPTTIVDSKGRIILWHLPKALSDIRQSQVWKGIPVLNRVIKKPAKRAWRASEALFRTIPSKITPGLLNMSPAWFQQGHETEKPEVSRGLKLERLPVLQWARNNGDFSRLMGGLLAIVHPKLYRDCMDTYSLFSEDPDTYLKNPASFAKAIEAHGNPFSGLALICNRETPVHRDNKSRYYWYDILATIGDYEGLHINVPAVGRRFSYDSGTLIAIAGRALTHEVPEADGERVCFAYFVRSKVLHLAHKTAGTWPQLQSVLNG